MSKSTKPQSLSEAIAELETAGTAKASELKGILEKDFLEIKKVFESMQPHFEHLKDRVESEARSGKLKVEEKVKKNPWVVIAGIGILALIIGWVLGRQNSGNDE